MAMILDAFMSKLSRLLVQMVQEEADMLLCVPGEIKKLRLTVDDIRCVLADAEKKQTESVFIKSWLVQLKDVMYDADDIFDLCQIKVDERCDHSKSACTCGFLHWLSCFRDPLFAHKMGTKIKKINSRLEDMAKRKAVLGLIATLNVRGISTNRREDETDPYVGAKDIVVGEKMEEDTGLLVSWLTEEGTTSVSVRGNTNIGVVAIVGMGGIGKTTLATKIFNDSRVDHFQLKIWARVPKEVKEEDLLKTIIQQAGGEPEPGAAHAQTRFHLKRSLEEVIKGKKFFLVLDNIWRESVTVWDELLHAPMNGAAHGSKLLVTTRDESVVLSIGATQSHHVEKMSDQDGCSLLLKQVFHSEEESEIQGFKDIGLKLVQKCAGLPLAIKSIGGVLRMKSKTIEEWEAVLKSNQWYHKQSDDIHKAFYLSYEDLPSPLKQCFIFCSLYPEDYMFPKTDLIYLWLAEGFLQGTTDPWKLGKEYYNELLVRNLLEDSDKMYNKFESKMHDVLRSFAHHLGKDENYILTKEEEDLNRQGYIAKLRRLSIEGIEVNPKVVKKEKGLRTLLIDHITEDALSDLCTTLSSLRVLDLSVSNISTLPDSLSSLVHLRYLDVSNSNVRTIPKSIGCLRNLVYLDFMNCKELRHVPRSITNLEKLMFLSFLGTEVEGIPTGLKKLEKLKELCGFRSSNNSLEMFSSLDELETLSHLVHLQLECLERVTDRKKAKEAKLRDKDQLQSLHLNYTNLHWEDQLSETNENKVRTREVLNALCPPYSLEILKIEGYFGSCLPNWLNSGTTLSKLRFLEITNCNCFEKLGPLGHLSNLDFLRIKGAYSIETVGEEIFSTDIIKRRDTVPKNGAVISAFPKLNKLVFERIPNWKEWQWNKGESAMAVLKQLYIKNCPMLSSFPVGLVHYATSLEYLEIDGAHNLTSVENFPSIKDIRAFRNTNLERISNLSCVSYLLIKKCPNLKTVAKLDALQRMELIDFEMDVLPEYLETVKPCKLTIYCNEELLRKIASQRDSGLEWHKFKHIPKVTIYSEDEYLYATYQNHSASPITTNITSHYIRS